MSKILIACSTKYGSTATICGWIKQRIELAGHTANVAMAEDMADPAQYDMVLMGSGIYGHKFLPSMDEYIKRYLTQLQEKKTGLFGVAMRTETFFKNGHAYGGTVILQKYGVDLGKGCLIGRVLGGEMIYESLSQKDKDGLEKFYNSIHLSDSAKAQRQAPRTLLNKKECWDFAEGIISLL